MAKILVVDDEVQLREILKEVLEDSGHKVILAEDGNKGLKLFTEHLFDLIITDLIMPDKEGLEFITEILKSRPKTKIIAISGGGMVGPTDYLKTAEMLGAQRSLEKPFSSHDLVACVEQLLSS